MLERLKPGDLAFFLQAAEDGHEIKELDLLEFDDDLEEQSWKIFVSTWRDVKNGCSLIGSVREYCKFFDVPAELRYFYYDVISMSFPEKREK